MHYDPFHMFVIAEPAKALMSFTACHAALFLYASTDAPLVQVLSISKY